MDHRRRRLVLRPRARRRLAQADAGRRPRAETGRSADHPPAADAFPLYYGDSIGFWDGPKLVIHTNQLMARSMGRNQPQQSEQMDTVEIWEKVDAGTIEADIWIYDPAIYIEPWYMQRRYTQVANADKILRMNYWHCGENPNNGLRTRQSD